MAELKATYDNQDDIPETVDDLRSLFTERDGKWEFTGMAGIKNQGDVDRVQGSLTKERADHKATKASLATWGDLDHDETVKELDRIPELVAAAGDKLDEAGIEAIVTKRVDSAIRSKTGPLERDLKKVRAENAELLETNTGLGASALKREREDVLRPLAIEAKVLLEHHEDVFMYGERHLEKPEGGSGFFAREGVGVTSGATPKDWLSEMLEKRPGWLPSSQGGGARGSNRAGGLGGKNPWTYEDWNMTEQGQVFTAKGAEHAGRLAAAAGTKVGGPKPKAKSSP